MGDIDDMLGMDKTTVCSGNFSSKTINRLHNGHHYTYQVQDIRIRECLVQHADTHIVKHKTSSRGSGFD